MPTQIQASNPTPTRRSAAQWRTIMRKYEQGDLNRKDFCARHSISLSTFDYWHRKYRRKGEMAEATEVQFVELSAYDDRASKLWDIELQLVAEFILRIRHRY